MIKSVTSSLFLFLVLPLMAAQPYYVCQSGGTRYAIELEKASKTLVIGQGKGEQRIPLAGPDTVLSRLAPSGPQLYFRENAAGKTQYTRYDLGTSVRLHYAQTKGETLVTVGITKDHREVTGLSCKTSRFKAKVVPLSSQVSAVSRHAEPILLSVDLRGSEGELSPIGVMGVDTGVQRFLNTRPNPKQKREFFEAISRPIQRVSAVSMGIIERRLPKAARGFWGELLQATRYTFYPKVQRYVDWILYGMEHRNIRGEKEEHWDSILAGMRGFGRSGAFEVKDFREFFKKELTGKIDGRIHPSRMFLILDRVPERRRSYFVNLWESKKTRSAYLRLKNVYAQYAKPMIRSLTSPPIRKKGFPVKRSFSEFTRAYHLFRNRAEFENPEYRDFIAVIVAPFLRKLTAEELKDLSQNYLTTNPDYFQAMRGLAFEKK